MENVGPQVIRVLMRTPPTAKHLCYVAAITRSLP